MFETSHRHDRIIIHGSMYHIVERQKRVALLRRLRRFFKQVGLVLGFAIYRYARYFYGVRRGQIMKDRYQKLVLEEI
jgi:hypothetical protein